MASVSGLLKSRFLIAAIAGTVWTLSFPDADVGAMAWLAPGLIAAAGYRKRGWELFRIGYVAGLVHYLSSLYWLLLIPYRWHGIPFGPATGWLALGGFMALFPASWLWLLAVAAGEDAERASNPVTLERTGTRRAPTALQTLRLASGSRILALPTTWAGRAMFAVCGATLWVLIEMVIARLFGGFPWTVLGVSQYHILPLIQIASVTGVYGVSFLVVWLSLALLAAGGAALRKPAKPAKPASLTIEVLLPVLVIALVCNWGFRRIRSYEPSRGELRMALIQPSIPQTVIWAQDTEDQRFREVLDLSRQALSNHVDILVWPEAAIPRLIRYDEATFREVTSLAREFHVWAIVGADDADPPPEGTKAPPKYYNSSFLINPEGKLMGDYRKRSLVIFGEYVPLSQWLPFLRWFTPVEGGFTSGTNEVQFRMPDLDVTTSPLICFEDIFPHLGRLGVTADTDFLINLTNDGWFGRSAAQRQHALTALFRAVENRVPLIRCTNNGLTCWIDAVGRLKAEFRDSRGSIHGVGVLTVGVPLPSRGASATFYTRHGDVFGFACMALGVAWVVCGGWGAVRVRVLVDSDQKNHS